MSKNYNTPAGRAQIRKLQIARQQANTYAQTPSLGGAGFGASPQTGGFGFGASSPAPAVGGDTSNNNNTNGGMFGASSNAFGATNSFPPTQQPAPTNAFSNGSFPSFGAGNNSQSSGFNPQPPSANAFNFGAGNSAPTFSAGGSASTFNGGMFGQNGASSMNGNASQQPQGGNLFGTNPTTNIFGGQSQNNGTSAASTGAGFGSTNATSGTFGNGSSGNLFGSVNATPDTPSQPTPAFSFGANSTPAQNTATTSAGGNAFGGFGSGQNATAPAQNSFGGFGSNAQNGAASQQETPKQNLFGTSNATATATPTTQFSFGANSTTTTPPTQNLFGASNAPSSTTAAPASNLFGASVTPSSAPASNLFSGLPTSGASTPAFTFGQQTPKAASTAANPFAALKVPEQQASTPKPLFGSVQAPEQSASTPSQETPKPNLFASLAKAPPASSPSSGFNFLGAGQQNDSSTPAAEKPSEAAPAAPKNFFPGFSTPQPAKTDFSKPQPGAFSAQPKQGNGLFAQDPSQTSTFSGFGSKATPATEAPKDSTPQPAKEASTPFNSQPTPSTNRPNLFAQPKQQAPAPSPSMHTLTGTSESNETAKPELPKISKAQIPKEWSAAPAPTNQNQDSLYNVITAMTIQLQQLNENYRAKIMTLSPTADWSALSSWHHRKSSAIKTRIDIAKKQRAAANGVTGTESSLSVKRKVNDGSPEERHASPAKRARPADPPATPTPQPATQTQKANPPATATSNLFAQAINNKPQSPSTSTSSNLFSPKAAATPAPEPSKPAAPSTGFQFTPSKEISTSQSTFSANAFKPTTSTSSASGGFKPTTSTTSASGGFKPTTTGGSGGFASQFAAKAKTYEQLAAERKKKAMEEDYDSEDETEAEWSAKYDKKEAERIAKEKEAAAVVTGFSMPVTKPAATKALEAPTPAPKSAAPAVTTSTPAANPFAKLAKSGSSSTPASNTFSGLSKPASGASTPGLFGSRAASPALSSGGSVFNAGSAAPSPAGNPFSHLSSASSNNQDDESDEERETLQNDQASGSVEPTTPPKRKFGASETDADESNDDTSRYKKQDTAPKGSLLSRMTRDEGADSEKENSNSGPMFGQTNGTSTPPTKPFKHFDFGAAAGTKSSPLKSGAGDQSYKEGTPIRFGSDASAEKATAPSFNFTSATPSTTPSKPPPSFLFNISGSTTPSASHLAPATTFSNLASGPSSVFSSRAATPTDAETSAASEDDEAPEQVDLSRLTAEERDSFTIVFESEQALAKRRTEEKWENFARGPIYILKDKVTGKCFVRIRIASGATPLNYSILPKLETSVTGSSGKMVMATMPKREGGFDQIYVTFKTSDEAKEFSESYNASLP